MSDLLFKSDCRFFRGDVPCNPNKKTGVHCDICPEYKFTDGIILIIKLGAIGDVIRTTPLLSKIYDEYPNKSVWWLTLSPEVVPSSVDKILKFNIESVLLLVNTEFSVIINLDKDPHAAALTKKIQADKKMGFTLAGGKPVACDSNADHKYLTGLFDDISQANTKSYLEEMFEICNWKFNGEEYILEFDESIIWDIPNNNKTIIGLNTGCGDRWTSRLWKEEYWEKLIDLLIDRNYFPVLLGGQQEHEKNLRLSQNTGAFYPGHFSLREFISLVNQCEIIITAVTMGLHLAIGLKKKVILINNIFNPNEFELYGRGIIVQPDEICKCYFSPRCKNPDYFCLDTLRPEKIMEAVIEINN